MKINLKKLVFKNFKGIKILAVDFSNITNIFGENATGKTTIVDGFTWLLFDKDSKDRKDFEIKTLDTDGQVIHGLEHGVTGILEVDGKLLTLEKVYKEKWTKRRGEALKQLTGHETLYYINEVPAKKSEYQEKVNSLINEDIFKLLTNPLYFSTNMKWQDRRKVLLDIIGDISTDKIINYRADLKGLESLLEDTDIDTLKKSITAKRKKLNDDIKSIPYRIDECNNSMVNVDVEALELDKKEVIAKINSIDEQIADKSKGIEEKFKLKQYLYQLKEEYSNKFNHAKLIANEPKLKLDSEFRDLKYKLQDLNNEIRSTERRRDLLCENIKHSEESIKEKKIKQDELRNTWHEENNKEFIFDENSTICPACGREYDLEKIKDIKEAAQECFLERKKRTLLDITNQGKAYSKIITDIEVNIQNDRTKIEPITNEIIEIDNKIKSTEEEIKIVDEKIRNFNVSEISFNGKEQLEREIKDIEQQIVAFKIDDNTELKNKKSELQRELSNAERQLAAKDNNVNLKARIAELENEEKKLGQQIAELEGQEFMCEEYIKTKVEILEGAINNKFKYVSFKLFDTQVNGGLSETCEALVDGVPFSNANTASQINAGLDIINALSNYYEVQAPIFIDNRESINNLIETNSQVINLIVSKDKTLKIESEVM